MDDKERQERIRKAHDAWAEVLDMLAKAEAKGRPKEKK